MKNIIIPTLFKCFGALPLFIARKMASGLGLCLYWRNGRDCRLTRKNLSLCLPELSSTELEALTKQSLKETAKTAFEACIIWRHSWAWLQTKIISTEGEALLRAELAKGQGLLVLAPHLGNWEVVAPYLASISPLTGMYKPFSLPALNSLILSGRCKCNINMVPANKTGVSMVLKALKNAGIVGILPDQVPEDNAGGAQHRPLFFGHPAKTISLVSALVSRTQCRVVSVFAKRVKNGFELITIPAHEDIYSEDIETSLNGLNLSIEACVRMAPAQYQWEYNRFRIPRECL